MFHRLFHAILSFFFFFFFCFFVLLCVRVCLFLSLFLIRFRLVFLPFAHLTLQLQPVFSFVRSFCRCWFFFSSWNLICPARFLLLYIPQRSGEHHLNHQNSYKNTFITFAFLSSSYSASSTSSSSFSPAFCIIITVIGFVHLFAVAFFALPELISRIHTHTQRSSFANSNANDCTISYAYYFVRRAYRLL